MGEEINKEDLAKRLSSMNELELAKLLSELESVSGLPYIANPKQLEFHNAPERDANQPVLYGGAMGGGRHNRNML